MKPAGAGQVRDNMAAVRYSDKPQLRYGSDNRNSFENFWAERFPAHMQPIATAPEHSGSPVYIYEPSGECHVWNALQSPTDSGRL